MRTILRERFDRLQLFHAHSSRPILAKLVSMQACPRSDKSERSPWQASTDHSQRLEFDADLVLAVLRMEVRWG